MNNHGSKKGKLDSVINSFLAGTQIGVPICFTESPQLSSLAAELWIPCCPLLVKLRKEEKQDPLEQGLTHTQTGTHTHTSHTETHALPQLTRTHTQAETHTHTDIDTHIQRPTHCLNSPDLTLHTEHLTDNPHSDFLCDEKCFRATRRLVFLRIFLNISRAYV